MEAVGRAMEEQAAVLAAIVASQDTIGGQTKEVIVAMEAILTRVAVVDAGLRGVRETQAADARQMDDVSAHVFRVEGACGRDAQRDEG